MVKKAAVLCLLTVFMLTGCGQEGLVMQQVTRDSIKRLDCEQEVIEAQEKIVHEDSGKWSYREENIRKLVNMENRIKESCKNEKTVITVQRLDGGGIASANMWAQHLAQGKDAKKEKVTGVSICLEMEDRDTLLDNCKRIAQLGFDCLNHYSPNDVRMIQNGCQLYVIEQLPDEEETGYYSIEIKISYAGVWAGALF